MNLGKTLIWVGEIFLLFAVIGSLLLGEFIEAMIYLGVMMIGGSWLVSSNHLK